MDSVRTAAPRHRAGVESVLARSTGGPQPPLTGVLVLDLAVILGILAVFALLYLFARGVDKL